MSNNPDAPVIPAELLALEQGSADLIVDICKAIALKSGLLSEGVALAESLLEDADFKTQLGTLVSNYSKLLGDVKSLTTDESVLLAANELPLVSKIVSAIKAA